MFILWPGQGLGWSASEELGLGGAGAFGVPAVSSAAKSGVRRLEQIEGYLHTKFLKPGASRVLRQYLLQNMSGADAKGKLETIEEKLEVVAGKVEDKIKQGALGDMAMEQGRAEEGRARLERDRERLVRVRFQLASVRYYLHLLDEDEIILSALIH